MDAPVYLVDGSGYIFRAFYAVAPLTAKDGFPTNALFGFIRMLLKTIKEAGSPHMAVVFDAGRKTFRNDLYAEYKANRTECPEDLLKQMPYFRQIAKALGFLVLEQPGFEADDIIGTLTKRLTKAGHPVVIVSGDKDLMQLVTDEVVIWDTMKDKRSGPKEVEEKFGVPPEKVVEVLALMGDTSDNIPGVDGVGPKTATQLIQKFGDVSGVINGTEALLADSSIRNRKKIADVLVSSVDTLKLSRRLVEIDTNVPVELDGVLLSDEELYTKVTRIAPDAPVLTELLTRFDFTSMISELAGMSPIAPVARDENIKYTTVWADSFDDFLRELSAQSEFAFDIETTDLNPIDARIVGIGFCWSDTQAYYVPFLHDQTDHDQVEWEVFARAVAPIFANPKCGKIGQNIKYDINVLATAGIDVQGVSFDTMVAAYILDPDRRSYNLTVLASDYLQRGTIEFDDIVPKGSTFTVVPMDKATEYTCQDAHYAWLLRALLSDKLEEKELLDVLQNLEVPLIPVLAKMERSGIRVDTELLSQMSTEFEGLLKTYEAKIYDAAGGEFNINSPKQLADILFNKLGISTKSVKKTKTGLSTDSSVLEKLSFEHPLPGLILEYRGIHKLKSTYVDALPTYVHPKTGRVHTSFNQTIAGTGRLSSSDPNLQNIPIQSAEGMRIRSAFVPETGNLFIAADYSQIELRLLAHLSEDENLIAAFTGGTDIHSQTAREVLNLSADALVDKEQRRVGKTINFGIVYGMGAFRLARDLGIPVGQASHYITNYFLRYPRVKEYFSRLEHEASTQDSVKTILGRKRFISSLDTSGRDQGFVRRAAMNAPLQGSAADIIKLAMIRVDRILPEVAPRASIVLQVHDELVIECPDEGESAVQQLADIIVREMESVMELRVPLKVDAGIGRDWRSA